MRTLKAKIAIGIMVTASCLFGVWKASAQTFEVPDTTGAVLYYAGINPLAGASGVYSKGLLRYLPLATNLETGITAFVGRCWAIRYNVETRCSFGSYQHAYTIFQVQSGFHYCFLPRRKYMHPYLGGFFKLVGLDKTNSKTAYSRAVAGLSFGNRHFFKRCFADLRIQENVIAISWSDQADESARVAFHPSVYPWKFSYIPYGSLSIGYMFR